jgi:hypothetical protein
MRAEFPKALEGSIAASLAGSPARPGGLAADVFETEYAVASEAGEGDERSRSHASSSRYFHRSEYAVCALVAWCTHKTSFTEMGASSVAASGCASAAPFWLPYSLRELLELFNF